MTLPEAMVYLINGRRIMNDRIELSLLYGLLICSAIYLDHKTTIGDPMFPMSRT